MEQIGLEGVFKTEAFASGLNKYTSGINQAIGDTTRAAGTIGTVLVGAVTAGVVALAALAAAGVAAGVAFGNWIYRVSDAAGEMAHDMELLSLKTNLSTTSLQEWNVAGETLGVTADDISMYFFRLSRSAYAAANGTKASKDAYDQLGVSVTDASGHLKDTNQLFYETIAALGNVKDPTLQDALALAIFGRNVQDLMPLIRTGTAGLKAFQQEAEDVGSVLDEKTVTAFANFEQQTHFIQAGIKGMTQAFAANFLPILTSVNAMILDFLKDLHGVKNVSDLLKVGKTWMTKISTGMTQGLAILKKNLPVIMKKVTDFLKQALPMIGEFGGTMIKALGQAIIDNAPAIMQAGRDLLKALASGLSAGLTAANIKIPKLGDIVSWIFGKATEMSAQFKAWVDGVDWGGLSRKVADAINAIPWADLGGKLGTTSRNIGAALIDMVKAIDWLAVGVALGAAFDNVVISVLHTGLKLGDVTDLAGLQTEWAGIGTQYGQVAAAGMAPLFWSELWKGLFSNTFGLSWEDAKAGLVANFEQVFAPLRTNWQAMLAFFHDPKMWSEVLTGIDNVFFTPLVDMCAKVINSIIMEWDKIVAAINIVRAALGMTALPLIPFIIATTPGTTKEKTATPSKTVRNQTTYATPATTTKAGGAKEVTNNITINNPSAEPASASVEVTMRRMN
jgi:hypothetical protein